MARTAAESKKRVIRSIRRQLSDPSYQLVRGDLRTQVIHDRFIMIVRQVLAGSTMSTPAHREVLENEAGYSFRILYENLPLADWLAILPDKFYAIGDEWKPVLVDMPSAEEVTIEEVHNAGLGITGGTPATAPTFQPIQSQVIHERRNAVVEWALREYPKAFKISMLGLTRIARDKASVFIGLIYNTLLQAMVDTNLSATRSTWRHVSANLVSVEDFVRLADAEPTASGTVNLTDLDLNLLYDERRVYTWNAFPTVLALQLGRPQGSPHAFVPLAAPGSAHYTVRAILGLPQDAGISDGTLSSLVFTNGDDEVEILQPVFASDTNVYAIVATAGMQVKVNATSTYPYATIKYLAGPGVTALEDIEGDTLIDVEIGKTCIRVECTSQDGTDTHRYDTNFIRLS